MADLLAPSYVTWVSGFLRWDDVNPRPGVFDWRGLDAVQEAAYRTGKPWKDMEILGIRGRGLPEWVAHELRQEELIDPGGDGVRPVFWSKRARQIREDFEARVADRYGEDPLHLEHRVTLMWRLGEPWCEGGRTGRSEWLSAYRRQVDPQATYRDLQLAYQGEEAAAFDVSARLWPDHTTLSMATGFAFGDYVTVTNPKLWARPEAHPDRMATWSRVRARYGDRIKFRQNGAGSPNDDGNFDGARGYGAWLEATFGPRGVIRGRIGCQMVKGVVDGDPRMDAARFARTIFIEAARCTDAEVYADDIAAAVAGGGRAGATVRETLAQAADSWR